MPLFIPPKHADQREPKEQVERTVLFQHSQDQRWDVKKRKERTTKTKFYQKVEKVKEKF